MTLIRKEPGPQPLEPHLVWNGAFVTFLHPGYEDPFNRLCTLPAADDGGVHYGTALTVCGIIANNAFNGYFAKERGADREPREWDSILRGVKFYFFASNNPDDQYPVVTSFANWQFPLTLPPEWNALVIPQESEQKSCRLSLIHHGVDQAHIVPQHELTWFIVQMSQFFIGDELAMNNSKNVMPLRSDLHFCFDQKMWCVVLKEGKLVCQTVRPHGKKAASQFILLHHNVEMQPLDCKSKECLFARIAWTILPLIGDLCDLRQVLPMKTTAIIENGQVVNANHKQFKEALKRSGAPMTRTSRSRSQIGSAKCQVR
ncbi:hypothetical protein Egran_01460 [Elaphomyces granulatus]|uniref:HNH nuclease domain-containing protein n=1 Tax=Elaphomyces granulatus TaxID=519963 RepID=A0A232M321_9EURO|nr:hypothetical protein Egran_01460 [Elaphomyces granulatus]